MNDARPLTNATKSWRPTWRTLVLWLALWLPWLYVGVFAYTAHEQYFSFSSATGGGSGHTEQREYGWPYEWRESSRDADGGDYYDLRYSSVTMLAVDLLTSVAIATVVFVVLRKWWGELRARGPRFRVSTLLLLMVLVSLPFAGWRYVEDTYEREIDLIEESEAINIIPFYKYQGPLILSRLERFLPARWLEIWIRCYGAGFEEEAFTDGPDSLARHLKLFSHLEVLVIETCTAHQAFAVLRQLPNVTQVEFVYLTFDDGSLKQLQSCDHLRKIEFIGCESPAKAVQQLRKALPDAEIIFDGEDSE